MIKLIIFKLKVETERNGHDMFVYIYSIKDHARHCLKSKPIKETPKTQYRKIWKRDSDRLPQESETTKTRNYDAQRGTTMRGRDIYVASSHCTFAFSHRVFVFLHRVFARTQNTDARSRKYNARSRY